MDASTLSAFAAAAAAVFAGLASWVQFYVGREQSKAALVAANAAMLAAKSAGHHAIAASRQAWINTVIETLSEYHALLMMAADGGALSPDDRKKMATARTKLEILLNPEEETTVDLLRAADEILQVGTRTEREAKSPKLVKRARKLLKAEWVRIKDDLMKERS
jgi:hypothetical protein